MKISRFTPLRNFPFCTWCRSRASFFCATIPHDDLSDFSFLSVIWLVIELYDGCQKGCSRVPQEIQQEKRYLNSSFLGKFSFGSRSILSKSMKVILRTDFPNDSTFQQSGHHDREMYFIVWFSKEIFVHQLTTHVMSNIWTKNNPKLSVLWDSFVG